MLSPYPIIQKQTAEVYVSYVLNPGEFYVQFSGSEVELENLAQQCAEAYGEETGDSYVVKNPEKVRFSAMFPSFSISL